MSEVFGEAYSGVYDSLYADKDYSAECDLIQSIVDGTTASASRVLDLGCGTGGHSLELGKRGYTVTGVDRSRSMLDQAERKSVELPAGRATFRQGDLLTLDLAETFDVTLMMFAVLGYQHENAQVLAALSTARRHLRSEGLLIFDVWYGPAVLHERPSTRVKSAPTPHGEIMRVTSSELNVLRHLCAVHFQVWRLEDDRAAEKTDETHTMRYFFPLELKLFLEQSGFTVERIADFSDFAREPDETTWNVLVVARAT